MPTRERRPLSYISFDSLVRTISRRRHLFAPYLPIRSIWDAKLDEVRQIRNRVAHFRQGNDGDLQRVDQLLTDIDPGIWRFCTSYNDHFPILPPSREKVIKQFIELDPFPWSQVGDGAWSRVGMASPDMLLSANIEVIRRPWLRAKYQGQVAGKYGYLFDINIHARQNRVFEYKNFLKNTTHIHDRCCHILLDSFGTTIRATLPSVLGAAQITDTVNTLIEMGRSALRPSQTLLEINRVDSLAKDWPEYVLGPDHPFSFLGPDMPCKIFSI